MKSQKITQPIQPHSPVKSRKITEQHPPLGIPMGLPPFFENPILVEPNRLLQRPWPKEIVKNVCYIIYPELDQLPREKYWCLELDLAQEMTLFKLLEEVVKEADTVLYNPIYNLSKTTSTYPRQPESKAFSEIPIGSPEQKLLKP